MNVFFGRSLSDVNILVPTDANSGGDMSVTSSCLAEGCGTVTLGNDIVTGSQDIQGCKILFDSDYYVEGPSGDLMVQATQEITVEGELTVNSGGQLSFIIDPILDP